ncbi:hypothetical protein LOC67_13135 [Stieleria sp. JC731]|uniref:hypothetical protein n=1 Tax=Pirellulaceae TaxID=2691357 RepID=UPI001E552FD4|nr:hypothetical protein [Stieleria sp. JC731]MCC9601494.1 hypothetical protein [Stieleria sp. JC731]
MKRSRSQNVVSDHSLDHSTVAPVEIESICVDSLDGWQDFELLPSEYRLMRDAKVLRLKWSIALVVAALLTTGSLLSMWVRRQRTTLRNERILAVAKPIGLMKQDTELLVEKNKRLKEQINLVNSAKPDDSLSQVIASIALATDNSIPQNSPHSIEALSLAIKLPLEKQLRASGGAKRLDQAEKSELTFVANIHSRDKLSNWKEELLQSPRISNVRMTTPSIGLSKSVIQIDASPLAARVIP